MNDSNHRIVIRMIDEKFPDGSFAIHEVRDATGVSSSTVTRVLRALVKLRLVRHSPHAFAGKHYRATVRWTHAASVIDTYEYAKALKIV